MAINSVEKTLFIPCQLCVKFGANINEMRFSKKESILVDQETYESVTIANSKQYALKLEKAYQKKSK